MLFDLRLAQRDLGPEEGVASGPPRVGVFGPRSHLPLSSVAHGFNDERPHIYIYIYI